MSSAELSGDAVPAHEFWGGVASDAAAELSFVPTGSLHAPAVVARDNLPGRSLRERRYVSLVSSSRRTCKSLWLRACSRPNSDPRACFEVRTILVACDVELTGEAADGAAAASAVGATAVSDDDGAAAASVDDGAAAGSVDDGAAANQFSIRTKSGWQRPRGGWKRGGRGGAREGSKQFLFAYGFQNTIRGIIREGITRIGVCPLPKLLCVVFWALLGGVCT